MHLVQTCAEEEFLTFADLLGDPRLNIFLGLLWDNNVASSQRVLCAVQQAMCTLARVGLISTAAREAARRRQVAMRMEAQMKEERKAQWMASLRGPGWADATEFEPNKHSMYTCSKFHI